MNYVSAAITDIGRVRQQNEDRFVHLPDHRVFGVADGIGGLPHGALAAKQAVAALETLVTQQPVEKSEDLVAILQRVNEVTIAAGERVSPAESIGTTLTVGVITDRLLLGHVGDSRCLLIRPDEVTALTTDHTIGNEGATLGLRATAANQHALTRCIGQTARLRVDIHEVALQPGDLLLFATDGLTKTQTPSEIARLLRTPARALQDRLADLVAITLARGAPDNTTAVAVEITD